ncbi:hypothetical protein OHB26_31020 [Nocardia sp. NBC_01503]|uniref:hypothetical protein n=1 Tax=Nocardia sp. NBC_01503 TaxID=2975997 RepID=UPI002E7BC0A7|nr:hypothetical protein [Nocardia sp. NBC_01503]WTL31310.1 hypothetical protein OHB26_31020 [Nocardia sp. NBC_01503]
MRSPIRVALGVIFALLGLLWSLQGFGVISGSAMSNTVTWSIIGPIVFVAGLVNVFWGWRGRTRT